MPADDFSRMDSSSSETGVNSTSATSDEKLLGSSPGNMSTSSTTSSSSDSRRERADSDGNNRQTRFILPGTGGSPPKILTMDEVQNALTNLDNMTLAHEIAVNPDFRLQPYEPSPNTLERNIKDMVHKAFWAAIREQLEEDPPCYDHAIQLLADIKDGFAHIVSANNSKALDRIYEVLDATVIQQQADSGVLDCRSYANFIVPIMARLCAPVRDDSVARLLTIPDTLDMFRGILEVMELMKLDMANCLIDSARKVVMTHSIEYEKECFREYLDVYTGAFPATEQWLLRHQTTHVESASSSTAGNAIDSSDAAAAVPEPLASTSAAASTTSTTTQSSPAIDKAIQAAYVELLQLNDYPFPETVQMDRERIEALAARCLRLCTCASVLALTASLPAMSGHSGHRQQMRQQVGVLLESVRDEATLAAALEGVWLQVRTVLERAATEANVPAMDAETEWAIRTQILLLSDRTSPVRSVMTKRLMSYASLFVLTGRQQKLPPLPVGFTDFADEQELFVGFRRITFYNYMVFGDFYRKILGGQIAVVRADDEAHSSGAGAAATSTA